MLNRRKLLAAGAVAAAGPGVLSAASCSRQVPGAKPIEPALAQAFDRIVDEQLIVSPEAATSYGLDRGLHADAIHHLDDRSLAGRAAAKRSDLSQLAQLDHIDRRRLSATDAISYDAIRYGLQVEVNADRRFDNVLASGIPYVLSQLSGAYQNIPDFLENQHRVEDWQGAEAYLDRLNGFARALDQEVGTAGHDVAAGVVPPDFALDKTLTQLRAIRAQPAGETQLVQSLVHRTAAHKIPGDWAARAGRIYARQVQPALDRQIAFVEGVRSRATHDAGVWKLPDGEAFYAASLKTWTSSSLGAAAIHRLGVELVAELTGRIDATLKAQGLTNGAVGERLQALGADPRFFYPDTDPGRDKLLADLNAMVSVVKARLPAYFGTLPKADLRIVRVPKTLEVGRSGGSYTWPALDGSRPGVFQINLRDTHEMSTWKLPTLVYHETLPGHHLQLSLQAESNLPRLRKITAFNAYIEGWALYAEELADEMGLYQHDPFGRIGYLQSAIYRAVRLVVDTGMHQMRWSREQALAYYIDKIGDPVATATSEIERYCVWPGQACTYMLGKIAWRQGRDRAEAALGKQFDIRRFHDAGLLSGSVPLVLLERILDDWTARAAT